MASDRDRGSFPAMGEGKRIVAVNVAQRRKIAGKLPVVGVFAGIKTQVLKQHHFAFSHFSHRCQNVSPDRLIQFAHGFADQEG